MCEREGKHLNEENGSWWRDIQILSVQKNVGENSHDIVFLIKGQGGFLIYKNQ